MESSGNFNTGDLKIMIYGQEMLDVCLSELNQTSKNFQNGLKEELEVAIKQAFRMGYLKATVVLQDHPSII